MKHQSGGNNPEVHIARPGFKVEGLDAYFALLSKCLTNLELPHQVNGTPHRINLRPNEGLKGNNIWEVLYKHWDY